MLGSTFYHQTIRKYVAVFGTLFNDLNVERKNTAGAVLERIKVPLGYGPKQKWILSTQTTTDDRRVVSTKVPRMGFALTGLAYDGVRKLNTVGRNIAANTSSSGSVTTPSGDGIGRTLGTLCTIVADEEDDCIGADCADGLL